VFNGTWTVNSATSDTEFTITNLGSPTTGTGGGVVSVTAAGYLTGWYNSAGTAVAWIDYLGGIHGSSKSFDISHPLDETKRLRHGSLEGPEYAVYVRGVLNGGTEIILPGYWSKLINPETISVQLTPIGKSQALFVEEATAEKVTVSGPSNIKCYYLIQAERIDIPKIVVEDE
jgi:hypothetical protein